MHNLYCVRDKKSSCAEYFIAACEEEAIRIWSVMCMSSRPMYEFLEEYELQVVRALPDTVTTSEDVVMEGFNLKRLIDARRKEQENGEA